MKITRRKLAAGVLASTVLASTALAQAQTPPAPAAESDADLLKASRDQARRNSETLAKFRIATGVEPAFQFKP